MSASAVTEVAVLGGGPAGVAAAYRLAKDGVAVALFEASDRVGGLAGSFDVGGVRVDYGSHRLHPSIDPIVLDHLRRLPGLDLQRRVRNGRIRLADRWVAFPLRPGNAIRQLPLGLSAGLLRDAVTGPLRRPSSDTFPHVLRAGVGVTLTERFYLPYARKIWGVDPGELSGDQARRRVSANSVAAIVRRMVRGAREAPWFWYPARGFGALSESLADAAVGHGAVIRLGSTVDGLERTVDGWQISTRDGPQVHARRVWTTLPLPLIARMVTPPPPDDVLAATTALRYRAMLLIYLVLDSDSYTTFDAHYFPESWTPITRISEPRRYRDGADPPGRTVLCAELPCDPDDKWWSADPDGLGRIVADTLAHAGLRRPHPRVVEVVRRRHAYPIATADSVAKLAHAEHWVTTLPGLLTLGRQGLFAHDNTHHAFAMAWAAADALRSDGSFDSDAWSRARAGFRTHVVED